MGTHPIFESDFDCLTEMSLKLGDTFPNLSMKTTWGDLNLYDYLGESWGILFSHPADYTPVCTTELGAAAKYAPEFKEMNTKLIGLSIDPIADHEGWIKDIQEYNKLQGDFPFPLISDDRTIATQLGMLDPATTGRNFDEIIRVIKSLQLTAHHKVATPQNWKSGDKCMVVPGLTDEQAQKRFAKGFEKATLPSGKGYIRLTPDPSQS